MIKFPKEYVLQLIKDSFTVVDINSDDFDTSHIDTEDKAGRIVFNAPDDDPLYLYVDCMEDEIKYDECTNTFMLKCFRPGTGRAYWLEAKLLVENRPDLTKAVTP
jgi:hypothetical protein